MALNYDNSIPFDNNIACNNPYKLATAIAQIANEIVATGKFTRWHDRFTAHLKIIVLNLFRCHSIDPEMFVAYPRGKSKYKSIKRYSPVELKYDSTIRIIDTLFDDLGYIEGKKGFKDRVTGIGKMSRMRATSRLIDLLTVKYGLKCYQICRHADEETIILKDAAKNKITYPDNEDTDLKRANLKIINDHIASNFIGLCVPDKLLEEINRELKNKKSYADDKVRSVLDFSRIKLKRIFNNSSFEQGGRFYHGWWQEIPSGYRKDIRINDICTCEIDFCGYHVNLLYALKKLPLPVDDVYTLDGFPPKSRDLLKTAVQILLNVDDEDKALSTFRKKFPRSKHPEVFTCNTITHERIIEAFKEKHKAIAKCFCRDYGIKIQFIDAEIAARILLHFTKKGIVALPIHDSFIVQRMHREELIETMKKVAYDMFEQELKVKEDPTAYDTHIEIYKRFLLPEHLPSSVEEYEKMYMTRSDYSKYVTRKEAWKATHPTPS